MPKLDLEAIPQSNATTYPAHSRASYRIAGIDGWRRRPA